MAKLTFRLVPGQDPKRIQEIASAYFRENAPPSVRVEIAYGHSGDPYLVDPHARFGVAAQKALRRALPGRKVALIREGRQHSIVADFKSILGADTLLLGFALPDCNAHSPNETFPVEHLDLGMRLNRFCSRNREAFVWNDIVKRVLMIGSGESRLGFNERTFCVTLANEKFSSVVVRRKLIPSKQSYSRGINARPSRGARITGSFEIKRI